jgi:hypothetical protein
MTRWPVRQSTLARWATSLRRCIRRGLQRNIGYAYLPVQHAAEGTSVEVETSAGMRAAKDRPDADFFDPARVAAKS